MESCRKTGSHHNSLLTEEENREQIAEVTADARVLASTDHIQQLSMQTLQNSEVELTAAENMECARWSSLDSVYSAFDEELSCYNLPSSDAALNVTFDVEVSSLSSCLSTEGLMDPKCYMKTVYDLDESAGIDNCINNCKGNKTFVLKTAKDDCSLQPGVRHITDSATNTLSPVVCKVPSLYTADSSDDETECHYRHISGKTDVKLNGKLGENKADLLPDFQMANKQEDNSANSFELEDKVGISARRKHVTSTPLSSPVEDCANGEFDTEGTVKLVQRMSSAIRRERTEHIPSACRMLQMNNINNTTEEHFSKTFDDRKFDESDNSILNKSFSVLSLEQDDHMFQDGVGKHEETYTVRKLATYATGDLCTNPLTHKRLASVIHSDRKAHGHRSMSSRCIKLQQCAYEDTNDDDLSISNIDVFQDDGDIASFFVTEWPSVLTNDYHALLLNTSYRKNVPLPQDDMSSAHNSVKIVVKSAGSPSDLFTDWSFSSLLDQVHPSFDATSVNDLGEGTSRHQSSMRRFSNITSLSELNGKQEMNTAGKQHLLIVCYCSVCAFSAFSLLVGQYRKQSCPWVWLTHGLGWIGYGSRIFF